MNNYRKSPCQYCGKREIGCHGKCGDYKDFAEECKRDRQKRFQYRQYRDMFAGSHRGKSRGEAIIKMKKGG